MAKTKYPFSISEDFPNQKVEPGSLTLTIKDSTEITTELDCINTAGDDCDIWFVDALSAPEVTALDAVVAAHQGDPIPWVDYAYADLTKTYTTTSTSYIPCVQLDDTYLVAGDYLIEYTMSWYSSNSGARLQCKVVLDDETLVMEELVKPREIGNKSSDRLSGFGEYTLSAGAHGATLYFASGRSNKEVGIFNAAISFRRVR